MQINPGIATQEGLLSFWDEETPFELSTEIWKKTKNLIRCIPEKLSSLSHNADSVELKTESEAKS